MAIAGFSASASELPKKQKNSMAEAAAEMNALAPNYTTLGFTETPSYLTAADINGEWQLATIHGKNVTEEEDLPYIYFESPKDRFYAYNGCNTLNGSFSMQEGRITFSGVAATMKYCPSASYEAEFNAAVSDGAVLCTTPIYRILTDEYLTLTDAAGHSVMTLRKKNMDYLNGNWQIVMADGLDIDDEEATVFLDMPALKIHANTGCNFVNGTIYLDPTRPDAIDFSNMGITRRGCPKTDQERAITVALESAYSAAKGSKADTLVFMDKSGKTIMKLTRLASPAVTE